MGRPTTARPKRTTKRPNNTHVFDPTPPEPVSNSCEFCKNPIDPKVLHIPGVICTDCHRPTCPDCRIIIQEVGLKGCFYCRTLELDERNETVKKELKRIREELLEKRRPPPIIDPFDPGKVMTTSTPMVITTDNTDTATPVTFNTVANTEVGNDQYPYRDPPNMLDKEGGWGVAPLDWGDEKLKPIGFATRKAKKGETVSVINQKSNIIPVVTAKDVQPGDLVTMANLKEEAQRGTGRTTQRLLTAIKHIMDEQYREFHPYVTSEPRRVLVIGNNMKDCSRLGYELGHLLKYRKRFNDEAATALAKRIDVMPVAELGSIKGMRFTMIIVDVTLDTQVQYGKELNEFLAIHQDRDTIIIGEVIKG